MHQCYSLWISSVCSFVEWVTCPLRPSPMDKIIQISELQAQSRKPKHDLTYGIDQMASWAVRRWRSELRMSYGNKPTR